MNSKSLLYQAFSEANNSYLNDSGKWCLNFIRGMIDTDALNVNRVALKLVLLITFVLFSIAFIWSVYTIITDSCFVRRAEFVDDRYGVLPTIGNVMGRRISSGVGYVRRNGKEKRTSRSSLLPQVLIIAILSFFVFVLFVINPAIFTSIDDVLMYVIPGICALLSVAFMTRFFGDDHYSGNGPSHDRDGILMVVCGIVACLQLSFCVPVILIFIYKWIGDYWTEDGLHPFRLLPLLCFLIEAISIIVAPGQWENSSVQIVSLWDAICKLGLICINLFTNPVFVAAVAIVFIVGMSMNGDSVRNPDSGFENVIRPILLMVICYLMLLGELLQAEFGVSVTITDFTVAIVIIVGLFYILFRTGQQIGMMFDVDSFLRVRGFVYLAVILMAILLYVVFKMYNTNDAYLFIAGLLN